MSKIIRNSVRATSTCAKFRVAILGDPVISLYLSEDQATDRAMIQAVGRRPFFAEVQVQSWGSLCGVYGEQRGILT